MTRQSFRSVLEEILSVPPGELKDTDTRNTLKDWSSLVDVQIMTVIGSELKLEEMLAWASTHQHLGDEP